MTPAVRRRLRVLALVVGWLSLAGAVAAVGVAALAIRTVQDNLVQVEVPQLADRADGGPLNILLVGSDSREGLSDRDRVVYTLGLEGDDGGGQRSDTVLLVSILPDGRGVNVVSFPRDLPVVVDGRRMKLTESFFGGPDVLVDTIQRNFGIAVHHYVEISVLGFISTVDALGSVEVCLPEPLLDNKSGANFPAGCQALDSRGALAFVRSRQGSRGDFERIERQQQFLKATLRSMVDARLLVDVPRLLAVVEEVASNVTTDDGLGIREMQALAEQAQTIVGGAIPMTVVPGYVQTIDRKSYVVPYAPGALALFDAIDAGELLLARGDQEQREQTRVAVLTGGRALAADRVISTLHWSGFRSYSAGVGGVDAGATTTVLSLPGSQEQARWVAATLGAPLKAWPEELAAPEGATVVVAAGDDAAA